MSDTQLRKLTPDDLNDLVEDAQYHVFDGTTMTVCLLTLTSGFTVLGQSACIVPADFDAEIGRDMAYRDAWDKLWQLEAYHRMASSQD